MTGSLKLHDRLYALLRVVAVAGIFLAACAPVAQLTITILRFGGRPEALLIPLFILMIVAALTGITALVSGVITVTGLLRRLAEPGWKYFWKGPPWTGTVERWSWRLEVFARALVVLFGIAYLAGLQAIPSEQYEAAQVDGANVLQRFRYITIPGLQHVMLITVMLSTIWTANTFDLVYLMTGGGPSNATQVFTLLTVQLGIQNGRIGEAATVPLLAMPFFAGLIVILTHYMLKREEA